MNDLRAALLRYGAKHQWGCTSSTLGPDPRCECGLSDLLAATPEPTLDAAWAEAEAAVPENYGLSVRAWGTRLTSAAVMASADLLVASTEAEIRAARSFHGRGDTPAAALRALAARLHERTASQDAGTDG